MDEIAAIDKYTLTDIAKSDRDIFEHVDIPKGEEEKYKVLKYLLEKGYIDEEYFFYISIFQEGRLTPSDQEFLLLSNSIHQRNLIISCKKFLLLSRTYLL